MYILFSFYFFQACKVSLSSSESIYRPLPVIEGVCDEDTAFKKAIRWWAEMPFSKFKN
jgi:hypothetical protein